MSSTEFANSAPGVPQAVRFDPSSSVLSWASDEDALNVVTLKHCDLPGWEIIYTGKDNSCTVRPKYPGSHMIRVKSGYGADYSENSIELLIDI